MHAHDVRMQARDDGRAAHIMIARTPLRSSSRACARRRAMIYAAHGHGTPTACIACGNRMAMEIQSVTAIHSQKCYEGIAV